MKQYDAAVIYCNEIRQPEMLLNEPKSCESVEEFMDFLYNLIASVTKEENLNDDPVLRSIERHAWTVDEFIEDGQTYANVSIYVYSAR